MNNNQSSKPDPKGKAEWSLKLAIIAFVLPLLSYGFALLLARITQARHEDFFFVAIIAILPIPLSFLFSIIAMILGILGFKSTKSNYALLGIGLSLLFWVIIALGIPFALGLYG